MPYLILGVAILVGLILAGRWYVNASPPSILRVFKWIAVIGCILIGIVIILTRQFTWAGFILLVLLPWLIRARQASRMAKNWSRMTNSAAGSSGAAPGQTSEIETKYLRMFLDHETGEMTGDVILGEFRGKTLRNLSFDDLIMLLGEIKGDNQSVQVLMAYIERYHGDAWHASRYSQENIYSETENREGLMTQAEAYKVLGLEEGASVENIKAAHRRLMTKMHPDHGGSNYLATKLNEAKDLLLDQ